MDLSLAFQHALTSEALAYWKSLLAGRAMPSRADLDLKKMRAFLGHAGLLELRAKPDGTSDYYVRLAGTQLEQFYGPMTNRFIGEAISPDIAERWRALFDAGFELARPIRTIGRMAFENRSWLEVESLVAPLSNDGKTVSMLFIVVAIWEAGKPPGATSLSTRTK